MANIKFTPEQEMAISEELGRQIVTLLSLEPTEHSRNKTRKQFWTSFSEKTYLGLGRTIIQKVEEATGKNIIEL